MTGAFMFMIRLAEVKRSFFMSWLPKMFSRTLLSFLLAVYFFYGLNAKLSCLLMCLGNFSDFSLLFCIELPRMVCLEGTLKFY